MQKLSARCEDVEDGDCVRCGKRKHSFWDDRFGDMVTYLCETRHWAHKIIAITHKAKAFDHQFIMNRAIMLKWKPELIMNGLKMMKMEHLVFLDSVSFLPFPLRKHPETCGLLLSRGNLTILILRKT